MEKSMENQIKCPNCGRVITANPVVDMAVKGSGHGSDFMICECGNRITYWAITAQLRNQKKLGAKIQNWFRSIFNKVR